MEKKKQKLSKQSIALIVILIIIVVLVILIAVLHGRNRQNQQITTTGTSVSETVSTTEKEEADIEGSEHIDKSGNTFILKYGKETVQITGLYYCKLPGTSKKDCYYFTNGKYDKSFKGVAGVPLDAPETDYELAYVKNGKIDRSFTGVASYNHYMRVFKNGLYQNDYDGDVDLGGFEASCENGAVLGVELGRDDGFVPPYKVVIED